ncbi:2833_t:CDS:2, partial [Dentiscutata erythropus]
IMATSSNSSTSSKERQKQLSRECQKWFRNKNKSTDTFEELQNLLNTKVLIIVVKTGKTPIIDTDSGSDSNDLSPLPNTEVPTITNFEFINTQSNQTSYCDKTKHYNMGRMDQTCRYCKAKFWIIEKDQNSGYAALRFPLCCANSKVQLLPLLESPHYLLNLYTSTNSNAVEFRKHARSYNSVLACTSFGTKVNNQFLGHSISNFQIHGQVYYLIGSLLPNEGHIPAFAQIYIYDTANKITNHHNVMQELNKNILQIRNIIRDNATTEISMIIRGDRNQDIRCYNALSAPDVAAIIVGDGHKVNPTNQDILLRTHDGNLQKIAEIYPSYNPLNYVLLFPKGDDEWYTNILLINALKRERVTTMQFYAYRLQIKDGDWIQYAGHLYQQYIVD